MDFLSVLSLVIVCDAPHHIGVFCELHEQFGRVGSKANVSGLSTQPWGFPAFILSASCSYLGLSDISLRFTLFLTVSCVYLCFFIFLL